MIFVWHGFFRYFFLDSYDIFKNYRTFLASLRLGEVNIDSSVDSLRFPESLLEKSAAFNSQPDAFPELLEKLKSEFFNIFFFTFWLLLCLFFGSLYFSLNF